MKLKVIVHEAEEGGTGLRYPLSLGVPPRGYIRRTSEEVKITEKDKILEIAV